MTLYDVLTVGDAASDVFIPLSGTHIRIRENDDGQWMELPYGGKVQFEHSPTVEAGGNAANAAVGFSRLGLSTAIATHVGHDDIGRAMQLALEREGIDTHLMRYDPGQPSNRNFVLWLGQDRTILVRHELYDYHWANLSRREIPAWVYLSSIGSDCTNYYEQIVAWLHAEPGVRLVLQPGTFQITQGVRAMRGLYQRAEVLVCNREEAVEIGGGDHNHLADLLESLHRLGPRTVVVTDGPDGAYASDGSQRYRVPAYPDPTPPKERTGAGDAFATTLVAALVKGLPLERALAWAPVNAMSVVQEVGSQGGLLREHELLTHLKAAPEGYAVTTW